MKSQYIKSQDIVSGVFDAELLQYLREWAVWGMQGEVYEPIPLQDVGTLL